MSFEPMLHELYYTTPYVVMSLYDRSCYVFPLDVSSRLVCQRVS